MDCCTRYAVPGAELAKREAQWLQKHDQATVGIMGLLPATLGEPVRFTATQSKEYRIFKNTRGILVNWELHLVDVALLQRQQAQELILRQTPRMLYVQIRRKVAVLKGLTSSSWKPIVSSYIQLNLSRSSSMTLR